MRGLFMPLTLSTSKIYRSLTKAECLPKEEPKDSVVESKLCSFSAMKVRQVATADTLTNKLDTAFNHLREIGTVIGSIDPKSTTPVMEEEAELQRKRQASLTEFEELQQKTVEEARDILHILNRAPIPKEVLPQVSKRITAIGEQSEESFQMAENDVIIVERAQLKYLDRGKKLASDFINKDEGDNNPLFKKFFTIEQNIIRSQTRSKETSFTQQKKHGPGA